MVVPEVQDGPEIKIDKCSVEVRIVIIKNLFLILKILAGWGRGLQ